MHSSSHTTRVWLLALLAILCPAAATPPVLAAGQEIAAEPPRSLRQLRADVRTAERRFQSLYDRLNRDSDQDLVCEESAPTGTRFAKRSCTTRAAQDSTSQAAREYIDTMNQEASEVRQSAAMEAIEAGGPVAAPLNVAERNVAQLAGVDLSPQQVAYRENLARLILEHPELGQRLQEYAVARQRLEAAEQAGRSAK